MQQAIKEKGDAYKKWQRERTERNKGRYKEKSRIAKRAVAVARVRASTEWSQNTDTKERKQKMFKIAKQMKEERKDVIGTRYVRDEHGNIKVEEADITQRWKRHFSKLLNEENQYELEDHLKVEGSILGVTEKEVKEALQKMKRGKAPGPSRVTTDLLKYAGETGVRELKKVFELRETEERASTEWRSSYTIPIYKGKGDARLCGKHRGARLLEHGMKLWEKILERRFRDIRT